MQGKQFFLNVKCYENYSFNASSKQFRTKQPTKKPLITGNTTYRECITDYARFLTRVTRLYASVIFQICLHGALIYKELGSVLQLYSHLAKQKVQLQRKTPNLGLLQSSAISIKASHHLVESMTFNSGYEIEIFTNKSRHVTQNHFYNVEFSLFSFNFCNRNSVI